MPNDVQKAHITNHCLCDRIRVRGRVLHSWHFAGNACSRFYHSSPVHCPGDQGDTRRKSQMWHSFSHIKFSRWRASKARSTPWQAWGRWVT